MNLKEPTLSSLKQRKRKTFEIIYRKYYRLVYYVALTIVKDENLAQDIMQDTFVSFMNHIEDYNEDGKIKQYLTTISRNLALNAVKRKSAKNEIVDDDLLSHASSVNNHNNYIEVMLTLEKTLSLEESNIVSLKVLFDYNFREIAEDLNLSLGVVQAKYYKAMEKLRTHFEKEVR